MRCRIGDDADRRSCGTGLRCPPMRRGSPQHLARRSAWRDNSKDAGYLRLTTAGGPMTIWLKRSMVAPSRGRGQAGWQLSGTSWMMPRPSPAPEPRRATRNAGTSSTSPADHRDTWCPLPKVPGRALGPCSSWPGARWGGAQPRHLSAARPARAARCRALGRGLRPRLLAAPRCAALAGGRALAWVDAVATRAWA
jgi:hypothetical protein